MKAENNSLGTKNKTVIKNNYCNCNCKHKQTSLKISFFGIGNIVKMFLNLFRTK